MALSPKTKEQIEHLKARAKGLAAKVGKGTKGTAISAGVGIAVFYGADAVANYYKDKDAKDIPTTALRWGYPVALIGGGHFVKRRQYDAGTGMAALGGFFLGKAIKETMAEMNDKTTSGYDADAGAVVPPDAMGWTVTSGDAGGTPISAPGSGSSGISSAPTGNEGRMLTGGRLPSSSFNVTEAAALYD